MCITALRKETIRIMAIGQRYSPHMDASLPQPAGEQLRGFLAAAVGIGIKGYVDDSRTITELVELARIEMGTHGAGDVTKTGLP